MTHAEKTLIKTANEFCEEIELLKMQKAKLLDVCKMVASNWLKYHIPVDVANQLDDAIEYAKK